MRKLGAAVVGVSLLVGGGCAPIFSRPDADEALRLHFRAVESAREGHEEAIRLHTEAVRQHEQLVP